MEDAVFRMEVAGFDADNQLLALGMYPARHTFGGNYEADFGSLFWPTPFGGAEEGICDQVAEVVVPVLDNGCKIRNEVDAPPASLCEQLPNPRAAGACRATVIAYDGAKIPCKLLKPIPNKERGCEIFTYLFGEKL